MARHNRGPLPLDRISRGLRAALDEAGILGGGCSTPAARCSLADGRVFLAVLVADSTAVRIKRIVPRRQTPPESEPEPGSVSWTPAPQLVHAQVTQASWLRRVIRLTGYVEAAVEYNARYVAFGNGGDVTLPGGGMVLVNGANAGFLQRRSADEYFLPFDLRSPDELVPAEIAAIVVSRLVPRLVRLQLRVGATTIYHEQDGRLLFANEPRDLPLPSQSPVCSGGLPVPAGSVPQGWEDRPVPSGGDDVAAQAEPGSERKW
jgi:hypothetical protein